MKVREKDVLEELENIHQSEPMFAGCTISHRTARVCVSRGLAKRDREGRFITTELGRAVLAAKNC